MKATIPFSNDQEYARWIRQQLFDKRILPKPLAAIAQYAVGPKVDKIITTFWNRVPNEKVIVMWHLSELGNMDKAEELLQQEYKKLDDKINKKHKS